MARTHARLLLTIWSDPEWRALPHTCQWLYELLISQAYINAAGVIELKVAKWSRLAADVDPHAVEMALKTLEERRFIGVDHDEGEVLVRSFMRNDGIVKQPYMMKAALLAATQAGSPLIRSMLLDELRRIDVSKLNVRKGEQPLSEVYDQAVEQLERGPLQPPPHSGSEDDDRLSDTLSESLSHSLSDTPRSTPSPTVCPTGPGEGEGVSSYVTSTETDVPAAAVDATPDRAHARRNSGGGELVRAADLNATAHRPQGHTIVTAWTANQPGITTPRRRELHKAVDTLLAQGADPALIPDALDRAHAPGVRNPIKALQFSYEDARRAAQPTSVPAGQFPTRGTDAKVAAWQSLKTGTHDVIDIPQPQLRALPGGQL